MPQTHEIKCHPAPFQALDRGDKRFEYRLNDRDYQTGDTLRIREYDPRKRPEPLIQSPPYPGAIAPPQAPAPLGDYTGRDARFLVTYCLYGGTFGLPSDHVVMSLSRLPGLDVEVLGPDEARVRAEYELGGDDTAAPDAQQYWRIQALIEAVGELMQQPLANHEVVHNLRRAYNQVRGKDA